MNKLTSKHVSGRQLPLELPLEEARAREDLIVSGANRIAIGIIDMWPDWPGCVTILAGPTGSGKSHIGEIWASRAQAKRLAGNCLTSVGLGDLAGHNLLIENVGSDDLLERDIDEAALFHLINLVRQHSRHMLITSRTWPQAWGVALPDLMSRLRAAQLVELAEPDDELLAQVMVKLFADRQLRVEANVIDYLVIRMERSLGTANRIVRWLDHHSLANRKAIGIRLAAEALQELNMA